MSKLERLLNLTALLLESPRPLTVEEIRDRIPGYPPKEESFRRTFERDKDDLREMGVPIELTDVPGTDPPQPGYRILADQYYLTDPGLEPDELAALRLAARSFRLDLTDDGGGGALEPFRKLGDIGDRSGDAGDDGGEPLAALPHTGELTDLFSAVVERRVVRFDYGGLPRAVHPYRIDFQRGRWYLTGHDESRGEERHFRIDRFEGSVDLGPAGAFERPAHAPGLDVEPWRLGEGAPVTARVRIDPGHVAAARAQLGEEARWHEAADGGAEVEIEVTNRPAFRSFVLGFLDHAEVLGPEELRTELCEWLEAMVA